jgi:hypothetical protein
MLVIRPTVTRRTICSFDWWKESNRIYYEPNDDEVNYGEDDLNYEEIDQDDEYAKTLVTKLTYPKGYIPKRKFINYEQDQLERIAQLLC